MTAVTPVRPEEQSDSAPPLRRRSRRGSDGDASLDGDADVDQEMAEEEDFLFGPSDDEQDDRDDVNPGHEPEDRGREDRERARQPNQDAGDPHRVGAEAGRVPRALTSPIRPSAEDVALHNITHLPYRNWCPICVRAKAKEDPHRRKCDPPEDHRSGLPIVSMDYNEYDKEKDDEDAKPVKSIVVKDEVSGSVLSYGVLYVRARGMSGSSRGS